jgi:hypothetical protein
VEPADEGAVTSTLGLPHERTGAVSADVVEAAQGAGLVANDDDGIADDRFGQIVSRAHQVGRHAQELPGPGEDGLTLALEHRGIEVEVDRGCRRR